MIVPNILFYGNKQLSIPCERIDEITPEVSKKISLLIASMYSFQGIGMAAPQIGWMKKVIVWDLEWNKTKKKHKTFHVMINPEIVNESIEDIEMQELCVSIPEVVCYIYRPKTIEVKYMDIQGNTITQEFDGQECRVIQHEIDHIEGKLMTDRITKRQKYVLLKQLNLIKKISSNNI